MRKSLIQRFLSRPGPSSLKRLLVLAREEDMPEIESALIHSIAEWEPSLVAVYESLPFFLRRNLLRAELVASHYPEFLKKASSDTVPALRIVALEKLSQLDPSWQQQLEQEQEQMTAASDRDKAMLQELLAPRKKPALAQEEKSVEPFEPKLTAATKPKLEEVPAESKPRKSAVNYVFAAIVIFLGLGTLYLSYLAYPGSFMFFDSQFSFGWVFLAYGIYRLIR